MRLNLILAFAGGAALASGLIFVGVRHYQALPDARPRPVALADATPIQPQALPEALPETATKTDPAPAPVSSTPQTRKTGEQSAARTPKPSPMPKAPVADAPALPLQASAPAAPEEERTVPPPVAQPSPEQTEVARNDAQPQQQAPEPAEPEASEPPPAEVGVPAPHSVTLAHGTQLRVRMGETLSTERNRPGDRFLATLEEPLVIDGFIIAERGARLEGEVVASDRGPRGGGVAHLAIRLIKLETADRQNIRIQTGLWNREGNSTAGRDAATILASTAIGAAIGAIAGGGKGAGIGAAAGGTAGTAGVLAARGPSATIPVETRLTFQVQQPVRITERLN